MIVGVVPAAGLGTRLPNRTTSKELVELAGEPVIEQLVRRLETGGCDRVIVVTRPEKEDVCEYAASRDLELVQARPASAGESVSLGVAQCAEGDIVAFGFPDTIWSPESGFRALVELVAAGAQVALGVFESAEPESADSVELDDDGRVARIAIKSPTPPTRLVWGCAAGRAEALRPLANTGHPGELFQAMTQSAALPAVRLGRIIDIGTPAALTAARRDPLVRPGAPVRDITSA